MTGRGAGLHWYRYAATGRVAANDLIVVRTLICPDCAGLLDRIAYRDGNDIGRRWVSFGYRCNKCNNLFVEAGK